jgi:hypothetical protein
MPSAAGDMLMWTGGRITPEMPATVPGQGDTTACHAAKSLNLPRVLSEGQSGGAMVVQLYKGEGS